MATSEVVVWARALRGSTLLAAVVLVAVNLVPLFGVLFWGWDVAIILISYWLENGIIGLINIPKILLAARDNSVIGVAVAGFFAIHYGGFWLGHGLFVFIIVGIATNGPLGFFFGAGFPFGGGIPSPSVDRGPQILLIALLLFLSHGISFLFNYVARKEYLNTNPMKQMFQPYGRLVILHVTIIFGAFLVIGLGQPVALVALLVILKTAVDLFFHLREHARAATPTIV
ncbi:MAG: DUF6498-containing protein [Candidatus Limnocylindrales bacterium]